MARRNKQRRSHLKRFASDYINTSQKPRFLLLDKNEQQGDYWFDNHGRVQSTTGPKNNKTPINNNTFMQPVPRQKGVNQNPASDYTYSEEHGTRLTYDPKEVYSGKTPKQKKIDTLHRLWQSERQQGAETWYCSFSFFDMEHKSLKAFSFKGQYCVMEENKIKQEGRRSVIYPTKDLMLYAVNNARVVWGQWFPIPPTKE